MHKLKNLDDSTIHYGPYARFVKRPLDFFICLIAIILFSPMLLVLCLLVRIKLGSPIFFKQTRCGRDEKPFQMIKFRTMTDARDESGNLSVPLQPPQEPHEHMGLARPRLAQDEPGQGAKGSAAFLAKKLLNLLLRLAVQRGQIGVLVVPGQGRRGGREGVVLAELSQDELIFHSTSPSPSESRSRPRSRPEPRPASSSWRPRCEAE